MMTTFQENRPTKNPRLARRVCRRSRVLGSDQIAENRALLEELEAGNTAGDSPAMTRAR
jgi:hypothetical protein